MSPAPASGAGPSGPVGGAPGAGRRLGFRSHLRVEAVPDDAVYLCAEESTTALRGAGVETVAGLLDGTRDLAGVLREAAPRVPAAEAARIVADLARAEVVHYTADDGVPDPDVRAYWDAAGADPGEAALRLARSPVHISGGRRADVDAARTLAAATGLVLTRREGDAALCVTLCQDYLDADLAAAAERHRSAGQTWLPVKPCGRHAWVGPVLAPGEDPQWPCWSCLTHRLRAHRAARAPVRRALGTPEPLRTPVGELPGTGLLGIQAAVVSAVHWLSGLRRPEHLRLATMDTLTLATSHHPVARRPQCPVCGDPGLMAQHGERPVRLVSRAACTAPGAGRRAEPASRTVARCRPLADPVTGVVSGVRPAEAGPDGLARFVSGRNLALPGQDSLDGQRQALAAHSGGKGATPEEAEAAALGEALERFCATRQGDEAVVRASQAQLGEAAVPPNAVQLFAERQFAERGAWNARCDPAHRVPPPFDPERVVDWTPAWSPADGRRRLLPASMVWFGPAPGRRRAAPPWADSNGNAAGTSREDAVVQGFLELVERDAAAVWWYNRTPRRAFDLAAAGDPWLGRARRAHADRGRDLWALDLTSDLGIPVAAAVSAPRGDGTACPAVGFGAHFDPVVALRRAVAETGQSMTGPERPLPAASAGRPGGCWAHLRPDPNALPATPDAFPYTPKPDLLDDVATVLGIAAEHGMDVLVVDQTRPDIGLPVVKVVVPGLRSLWPRFAPGRLFEVPLRLGLRRVPVEYEELAEPPFFL